MTLEQLRVFVAVAERQHMTRAAEALHMAQSAVSAAIAALESRHRARLFNRIGRGIELTEAGTLFLDEARAVLARAEAAELVLSELGGLRRGTLTIHASKTIASYWLPRHLVAFRRAYPAIDIKLSVGNTAQVAAAVQQGIAQIGFIEGAIDDTAIVATPVARDQLVVVVGLQHPWVKSGPRDFAQLVETEWVLREAGSGTRSEFEAALAAAGVAASDLKVALELPSNEAICAAVEAGLGATAISASVAAAGLETGLLHRVDINLPERAFQAIQHVDRYRSAAAERLLMIMGAGADRAGTAAIKQSRSDGSAQNSSRRAQPTTV
ncbi:DNA-binding transcriptional regulator, LysR family [Enhydrobacter aerosaccus]|uniref:DNA-binding transcriptional regulator, LysR family n=1 Tax=Enhydrobacter aerosaccus TaxID=225324 RepID=A0A1T4KYX7_9HYPH|nr:LysR substrate-binding domain-containing protein [Enhydrobacter aerosaccus]SJZ47548.1 DNA-binding transcriptional regulator, LysR family [Enhydrobacter aerosaccus]